MMIKKKILPLLAAELFIMVMASHPCHAQQYEPSWRPLSSKKYASYAEWYYARVIGDHEHGGDAFHRKYYGKQSDYRQFGLLFKAELFDPINSDGGEWAEDEHYGKTKEFRAWLYNEAPNRNEVVVNDRWCKGMPGHHGDSFSSEYQDTDRGSSVPAVKFSGRARSTGPGHPAHGNPLREQ